MYKIIPFFFRHKKIYENKNPYNLTEDEIKYFLKLTPKVLYKLYNLYKIDIEMFGYKFPDVLMNIVSNYKKI